MIRFARDRRGKAFVAIFTVGLILATFQHLAYIQDKFSYYYHHKLPSGHGDPAHGGLTTEQHSDKTPAAEGEVLDTPQVSVGTNAHITNDAHRFMSADDFLPHFNAVRQQQGMTIAEAMSSCTWKDDQLEGEHIQFMHTPDIEWAVNLRDDTEIETRRQQLYEFIDTQLLSYKTFKDRFEGRGIIVVAEQKGLKRLQVLLRALQLLNSKLPVEIHYFDQEMSEESKSKLRAVYHTVHFSDLSRSDRVIQTHFNTWYNNYHLKPAGLVNSRFAEVVLLDSDNIPVVDPDSLFDTEIYKEYGTIFWPDIARTRPENPVWAISNTKCRMDEYSQESGQLLVDKRKYFYHLQIAYWLTTSCGDYYSDLLLGDKDMFRFTWHAMKTKFGFPPKFVTSVGTLSTMPDGSEFYCGHSFAQHHPNGSVAFLHGGALKTWKNPVIKYQREERGGIFQVYKRSRNDEDHSKPGGALVKWDGGLYLPNRPEDLQACWCNDLPNEIAKPLENIIPGGFEHIYEEAGGYWMLENT